MAVGYGGLISIKDEADCTDCYLNQGEQTEAARGRNAVVINSRRVDRRQEHSNEPHIKFRGSLECLLSLRIRLWPHCQ